MSVTCDGSVCVCERCDSRVATIEYIRERDRGGELEPTWRNVWVYDVQRRRETEGGRQKTETGLLSVKNVTADDRHRVMFL